MDPMGKVIHEFAPNFAKDSRLFSGRMTGPHGRVQPDGRRVVVAHCDSYLVGRIHRLKIGISEAEGGRGLFFEADIGTLW